MYNIFAKVFITGQLTKTKAAEISPCRRCVYTV